METTVMGERGQVVIPQAVRALMGLEKGALFEVVANKNAIVLKKQEPMSNKEFANFLKSIRGSAPNVKHLSRTERQKIYEEFRKDPNRSDVFRQLGLD